MSNATPAPSINLFAHLRPFPARPRLAHRSHSLRHRLVASGACLLAGLLAGNPAGWAQGGTTSPVTEPALSSPAPSIDIAPETIAARTRWATELRAFDTADPTQAPAEGGVLFVGSSSVRLWTTLAQDFAQWPGGVINRGFGGSTLADVRALAPDLVLRHRPRHVLVYAGDNDLAQGRTPRQVMDDFAGFASAVRDELPEARISFIAIKPSPARQALLPEMRLANALVAAYLRTQAGMDYIDVFTPMLDATGQPRPELFRADRLHLNAEGYRLWRDVISAAQPARDGAAPALHQAARSRQD